MQYFLFVLALVVGIIAAVTFLPSISSSDKYAIYLSAVSVAGETITAPVAKNNIPYETMAACEADRPHFEQWVETQKTQMGVQSFTTKCGPLTTE
jgi:hypothetical protein